MVTLGWFVCPSVSMSRTTGLEKTLLKLPLDWYDLKHTHINSFGNYNNPHAYVVG